jgi:hypothetical protein
MSSEKQTKIIDSNINSGSGVYHLRPSRLVENGIHGSIASRKILSIATNGPIQRPDFWLFLDWQSPCRFTLAPMD